MSASVCTEYTFTTRTTLEGYSLLKEFEGFHPTPYLGAENRWQIGYGHTRTIKVGMKVSRVHADILLDEDVRLIERYIARIVTVPLNDNQFSALSCFVFNVGSWLFENSHLLRLLNRGWYDQVPAQLHRFTGTEKLLGNSWRRRAAEATLWKKGTA